VIVPDRLPAVHGEPLLVGRSEEPAQLLASGLAVDDAVEALLVEHLVDVEELAVRGELDAERLPADAAARIEPDLAAVDRLEHFRRRAHLGAHRRRVVHAGLEVAAVADAARQENDEQGGESPHTE
jgi:hypothetical protein